MNIKTKKLFKESYNFIDNLTYEQLIQREERLGLKLEDYIQKEDYMSNEITGNKRCMECANSICEEINMEVVLMNL